MVYVLSFSFSFFALALIFKYSNSFVFKDCDSNADKLLSHSELKYCLNVLAADSADVQFSDLSVKNIIDLLDQDKDAQIDPKEYELLRRHGGPSKAEDENRDQTLATTAEVIFANGTKANVSLDYMEALARNSMDGMTRSEDGTMVKQAQGGGKIDELAKNNPELAR